MTPPPPRRVLIHSLQVHQPRLCSRVCKDAHTACVASSRSRSTTGHYESCSVAKPHCIAVERFPTLLPSRVACRQCRFRLSLKWSSAFGKPGDALQRDSGGKFETFVADATISIAQTRISRPPDYAPAGHAWRTHRTRSPCGLRGVCEAKNRKPSADTAATFLDRPS